MIIISQNKHCIVNFDNASVIYINRDTSIVCDDVNGDLLCELGEYTTLEECNTVLEQLMSAIESYLSTNQPTVIYMPQRRGED